MTCVCTDCSAPITRQSKTGRCKPCATRISREDPAKEAKRLTALRAAFSTPEHRAKMSASRKRTEIERRDDPAWQAYKRRAGQKVRALYDADPGAQARNLAKRAKVGRQLSEQRLAWCPSEHRAEYQRLRKKHGAAAARVQIIAKMSPFERQLMRLREGAALVTVQPRRSPDLTYTPGGVASGML